MDCERGAAIGRNAPGRLNQCARSETYISVNSSDHKTADRLSIAVVLCASVAGARVRGAVDIRAGTLSD